MNKLLVAAVALSLAYSVSGSAQSMPTFNQSSTYTEEILATRPYRILYTLKGASAYAPKDLPNVTNGGFYLIYQMKADAAQGKRTLSAPSYTVAGEREYGWKIGSRFDDDLICSITGADGKLPVNFNYTSRDGSHFTALVKLVVELCPNVPYNRNEVTIRTRLWTKDANRRFLDVYRSAASGRNIEPALAVAIARSGIK